MICSMCSVRGVNVTQTWKCACCNKTQCKHMIWVCGDCGAKRPIAFIRPSAGEHAPHFNLWDVVYKGKTVVEKESYTIADQVRVGLTGGQGIVGECREVADRIKEQLG